MFLISSPVSVRPIADQREAGVSSLSLVRRAFTLMDPLISIVDDDDAVRDALKRLLNSLGFRTEAFSSARHFLDSDQPSNASCLILDVRMPEMSGIALQDYLTSRGYHVPTILITACPTATERTRAIAGGAVSYLAKPLGEQVLLDAVRDALAVGVRAAPVTVTEQVSPDF